MDLSNLKPASGSTHNSKRVGRGEGSGKGGTSKRGDKGAKSRSGYSRKAGFEGGQMPLQRRLPKFGFKSINRVEYVPINVGALQELSESKGISEFTPEVFIERGFGNKRSLFKVLGNGELNASIQVKAHAFSKSAATAIEAKGGSISKV